MLVGFDFKGTHFFGDHPKELKVSTPWDLLRRHMSELARDLHADGCKVINTSMHSALTFWPKKPLAEALASG